MQSQDIANIFGALDGIWNENWRHQVWTEPCQGGWNWSFDDEHGCFTYPSATSIFVYRKTRPGDCRAKDKCSCARAAGVKESRLHVWLYVHEDEHGETWRWIPQEEVLAGTHETRDFLSEHLIYQTHCRGCSNGPPLLICTESDTTQHNGPLMEDIFEDDNEFFLTMHARPADICTKGFRCKQCGLHLDTKWFRTKP